MTADVVRLLRLLGPLRRAQLHATRAAGDLPDIPEAHVEVLRLLAAEGPLTSGALALRLYMARSTISNLVKTMVAQGLLETTPVPDDLRSVSIGVSAFALQQLQRYDETGVDVLAAVLRQLDPDERAALTAATPVLEKVTALLASAAEATGR
ncbi:MarR family winged helix-turn-helix transcriptional regulator [Mycolicibacterium sp. CBM1]